MGQKIQENTEAVILEFGPFTQITHLARLVQLTKRMLTFSFPSSYLKSFITRTKAAEEEKFQSFISLG